jgi:hypothetical protein
MLLERCWEGLRGWPSGLVDIEAVVNVGCFLYREAVNQMAFIEHHALFVN